jgi:hypothetical protein
MYAFPTSPICATRNGTIVFYLSVCMHVCMYVCIQTQTYIKLNLRRYRHRVVLRTELVYITYCIIQFSVFSNIVKHVINFFKYELFGIY